MNNITLIVITFIFIILLLVFIVIISVWGTGGKSSTNANSVCDVTSDCGNGMSCIFGTCKSLPFTSCSGNQNVCQAGAECINGICIPIKTFVVIS